MDRPAKRLHPSYGSIFRKKRIKKRLIRRVPAVTTTDLVDATVFISVQTNAVGEAIGTLTVQGGGTEPQVTAQSILGTPSQELAPSASPAPTQIGNYVPGEVPEANSWPVQSSAIVFSTSYSSRVPTSPPITPSVPASAPSIGPLINADNTPPVITSLPVQESISSGFLSCLSVFRCVMSLHSITTLA